MKKIKLTQGKFALVSDEDYHDLIKWDWFACKSSIGTWYAKRNDPISKGGTGKRKIYMHRQILGVTDPKIMIDHKDNNGLNNTRKNIRVATRSQNGVNTKSRKNSTSKYIGVSFKTANRKWVSQIQFNNKQLYLGLFDSEKEAAKRYDLEAKKLFGEYANLNFNKNNHGK